MGSMGADELAQWEGGGNQEKILVSVRLRPLSDKEIAKADPSDWECINDTTIIFRNSLQDRPMAPTAYTFDRVFHADSTTREVYEEAAKEVALKVLSGVNSSIFAYGQTSSGKTYTMMGITEYTMADIYEYISKHEERAFVLKFSAIEIYNEVVKDLLNPENTPLRLLDDPEKGTIVEKLTEEVLRDWKHLKDLISICEAQRKTGETYLNEFSSRSHQILRLTIESSAREFLGKDKTSTLVASVNFVDLAGSERASQALSGGTRLKEGCHINRSLLTLGTVIRKLSKGRNAHIPYRESKLTRILQPSLGGNARTAIICTMSPARSHIEQSRNTLLFASCAKEVVTNAQVNVVMSDKALVKHLQREVARLESELRVPHSYSKLETLLREKEARIQKMDKEMKELKQQRDLAQSRLEDLLRAIGEDPSSKQLGSSEQTGNSFAPYSCEDEQSTAESSEVIDQHSTVRFTNVVTSRNKEDTSISPFDSMGSPTFGLVGPYHKKNDSEDHCKEVRCIETDETVQADSNTRSGSNNTEPPVVVTPGSSAITLEQHLENVRRNPISNRREVAGFKGFQLGRSQSCRYAQRGSSNEWLENGDEFTPPNRSLIDFPGRPEGFGQRRGGVAMNCDTETDALSRDESMLSESAVTSRSLAKTQSGTGTTDGEFTGINDFVAELKEMAQNVKEEFGPDGAMKSLSIMQSPSRWPLEFEKKQQEIIELWQACQVSLVHRTYFFLLFKGDPADSIYMEVELRRLSFVKNTYIRGSLDGKAVLPGVPKTSLGLSSKKLQREREMLCKQMQRRLTYAERESIYTKWGISLSSKRRRAQLASLLWTESKDLEHVRESASLVARLIGLLEPGQALREMFGLSFAPQQSFRRSYNGWRYNTPLF
ncbi:hypothetical protein LUZ61_010301 [Rhynchospora tenuis]|uniref:Kinesin-like protein n=1 Tax=Rhynchospora tenuis TaxID=198213 RepID=A0AAD5ZYV5_9POAL|nr:hypothetical protein LUZ61_010301 [Rhynchospora tenuis]